jgi:hypothetical protein
MHRRRCPRHQRAAMADDLRRQPVRGGRRLGRSLPAMRAAM